MLDSPTNAKVNLNAPTVKIISFVTAEESQDEDEAPENEGWIGAVREVEKNLNQMVAWLQEKKGIYRAVETPDAEASLIQSTIASYTAATANELEELRSVLLAKRKHDYAQKAQEFEHHNVIVQTLLQRLKEGVAEPFGKVQKQRQRDAVRIWQNPLQVQLFIPPTLEIDEMDATLGIAQSGHGPDQRFVPLRPRLPLQQHFLESYGSTQKPLQPPVSLFAQRPKRPPVSPSNASAKQPGKRLKPPNTYQTPVAGRVQMPFDQDYNNEGYQYAQPQDLQQEAVLLKASLENDLDEVQQMETTMVHITTLLSQFADLVAGQQEEIVQIHEAVSSTKDNLEKGQENLVDAADRAQQSRHYMATAITAMGMMLLFVHWIRP
jgi:hypothetical protein